VIKAATSSLTSQAGVADSISTNMQNLVKGRLVGSNFDDQAAAAEQIFRNSIKKSHSDPQSVIKSLSPRFSNSLGRATGGQNAAMQAWTEQLNAQLGAQLGKSFTISGPGAGTSLVPYDLSAPAKLIYPVYSPFRNRIPRTQGQGVSHEAKIITNISGALPGTLGVGSNRMGLQELLSAGTTLGTSYPVGGLPAQGAQSSVDVNVPYKFFGLTEQVSWLAQFAGQGFDDAAGLASLILLQEMMLLEERAIIGGCATNLAAPAAPGVTLRTAVAGAGETALSGITTNVFVRVTALSYYGETAPSAATSVAPSTQVADVQIAPVAGALGYNIYLSTGASEPANGSRWLAKSTGATKVTVSGALPTTGSNPPASDTGTGSAQDYDGLVSIISGKAAGGTYPAGFKGSYVNQSAGDVFSINVLNNALLGMWQGYLADPDEIWTDATGAISLSNAIAAGGNATNYRFNIDQGGQTGARAGVAISELVNPHTRKVVNLKVHPYIPSGTAMFMSWTLPHPWANVSNVWENVMVQDYLSISWPVIDVTFKFSMFMYGSLFTPAAQYNGIVQGLQNTNASTTTSWS
jgi:hypothetical protein